jgi:hypothetical protein
MKLRWLIAGVVVVGAIGVAVLPALREMTWLPSSPQRRHAPRPYPQPAYSPPAVAFQGDSGKLRASVVVPTLDAPLPPGKNVIWCATFQLAWDRLKHDVAKEPVRIANAEAVAGRLNGAPFPERDLPEDSYYAAAGRVADGIVPKIRRQMQERFRKEPRGLDERGAAIVAFAYLAAQVRFTIPYFEEDALAFVDSRGQSTNVSSFGVAHEHQVPDLDVRRQIDVLYAHVKPDALEADEFALDLSRDSKPNQMVIACVSPKARLRDTLEYVERNINDPSAKRVPGEDCGVVCIPNLNWSITHHFTELEGLEKRFLNRGLEGLYSQAAVQIIDFRLDRSGVVLESHTDLVPASQISADIYVNRPFLLYVKKRGAPCPFFVMWVDNAELLSKPGR